MFRFEFIQDIKVSYEVFVSCCPGSLYLPFVLTYSLSDCQFRILTQRVT